MAKYAALLLFVMFEAACAWSLAYGWKAGVVQRKVLRANRSEYLEGRDAFSYGIFLVALGTAGILLGGHVIFLIVCR